MERITIDSIPKAQEVTLKSFLTKREFYRDVTGVIRSSLIYLQLSLEHSPSPLNGALSILKLSSLLSIRPSLTDVQENGLVVKSAYAVSHRAHLSQGVLYLIQRVCSTLDNLGTAGSGLAALAGGGAFSTGMPIKAGAILIGAYFSVKAKSNSDYFSQQVKMKSNNELINWIKSESQSTLTDEEDAAIRHAVMGKAEGGEEYEADIARLTQSRLLKKNEWIREAIGAQAFALVQKEIDPSAIDDVANYVRREMQLKRIAIHCNLAGSLLAVIALGCLHKAGDIKKYAFVCFTLGSLISLPDAALHRKIYQYQTKGAVDSSMRAVLI